MAKKIYIPQPIAEVGEQYLKDHGCEIIRGSRRLDVISMKEDIADCDAMILRTAKVTREVLEAGKKLQIVARHGAGYDNLDVHAAKENGIITTYSPDTTALSVAEFTISAILVMAKRLKRMEAELRNDNFNYKFTHKGMDVSGKTLGIIGFGNIGRQVAKKAAFGLDMKVITYVPRPEGKTIPDYVELVSWEVLFKEADFVSVHVPGSEANTGLIGTKEFMWMKPSAYLIQVSRGDVVDEDAFACAVKNGEISGGLIDVFETEPPMIDDPLFELDDVLLTPHIGSNTEECMERIALDVAEDVMRVLSGQEPRHPIP